MYMYIEQQFACYTDRVREMITDDDNTDIHSPMTDCVARHPEQIPQAEDRYDLYLENKSWEKAAEAAARLKDPRYSLIFPAYN